MLKEETCMFFNGILYSIYCAEGDVYIIIRLIMNSIIYYIENNLFKSEPARYTES